MDARVCPTQVAALFASFDPDASGEITFRELYKMLRHNPDQQGPTKVAQRKKASAEVPEDLSTLRQRMKIDMFKMELETEVLAFTRTQRVHGQLNPSLLV